MAKTTFKTALIAALALAIAAFASAQELSTATLYAEKIYCDVCAAVIGKALRNVSGVGHVNIDVARKEVIVRFDPAKTTVDQLTAATAKRGFASTVRKVEP